MTASDPLNTTPWKPVDLDWGDGETVRVIDHDGIDDPLLSPGPKSTTRDMGSEPGGTRSRSAISEPARLIPRPSADDHHDTAIRAMVEATRLALDSLDLPKSGAMQWAKSIRYHDDVMDRYHEAAGALREALDLIDLHENG